MIVKSPFQIGGTELRPEWEKETPCGNLGEKRGRQREQQMQRPWGGISLGVAIAK